MKPEDTSTGEWPTTCEAITGAAGPPTLPPPGPLCLVVTGAPRADAMGRSFELGEGRECVIGRSAEASLRIEDPGLSRRHARVGCEQAGRHVLTDLGSSNGTYVNGRRVTSAVLREGDRIQLGTATVLRFSTRPRLDEGEQRQQQALAAAGVGTWEWDVVTRRLTLARGAAHLADPGQLDAWLAVHPDDRQRLREDLLRALAAGATADLEARLLGPAGRASWVSLRGELLRDESGAPLRFAGALVDVSSRKQAEQELRRQALMFECLSDAVLVVDQSGAILDWNPAAERLFGHTRAEAIGRGPGELLEPGEREPFLAAAAAGLAAEGRWRGERLLRRRSGGELQAELDVMPLQDPAGRQLAALVVCRDVGEQRRRQAQLLLADRLSALGTLAAGVAHEINNPLAYVQANLCSLRELVERPEGLAGGEDRGEVRAMLADMVQGVERIGLIVRELKTYGQSASQAVGGADVGQVVDYALRIVQSETRRRARVVKELGDVPIAGMAEAQLGQVLVNLLVNAVQAVGDDADRNEIRIGTAWDEAAGAVVLRVSDTGAGIPAAVLPRIFDPFFTTKPPGIGTGLGLFVCRNLVDAAGGTITVESRPGRGTTFTIILPRASPAVAAEVARAASPVPSVTPAVPVPAAPPPPAAREDATGSPALPAPPPGQRLARAYRRRLIRGTRAKSARRASAPEPPDPQPRHDPSPGGSTQVDGGAPAG